MCGAVTYALAAEPLGARMCWCRDCQYIASGSATVNVLFPEAAFRCAGDIGTLRMTADSGNTVERGFCRQCGSQIYSRTTEPAGTQPIRIRAGTLDNPGLRAPDAYIWTDSAPAWAPFDPALPRYRRGPGSARKE
nr:GFA family protein [Novosphingobium piscinae]